MQRSSAVLLGAGGAAVLVTLGVLVRAVHSESAAADASTTSHPSAPIASRGGNDSTSSAPAAWRVQTARVRAHRDEADDSSTTPAPRLDEHAPPATRGNTEHLEFGGKQLRAQTAAVEPLVIKCIDDAVATGQSPSGKATLTYIVTRKGDKTAVEDTGIDDDKTTIPGGALLDCLRETSRSMTFEGLPREAEGIVVTRAVTIEQGKLVGNKHVTFSYLR